jgi:hypothetical protein
VNDHLHAGAGTWTSIPREDSPAGRLIIGIRSVSGFGVAMSRGIAQIFCLAIITILNGLADGLKLFIVIEPAAGLKMFIESSLCFRAPAAALAGAFWANPGAHRIEESQTVCKNSLSILEYLLLE